MLLRWLDVSEISFWCLMTSALGNMTFTHIWVFLLTLQSYSRCLEDKKVKVAHTRLLRVMFWSSSRLLAVSLQVTWIINPTVNCHYFPPGLTTVTLATLKKVATNFAAWWIEVQWVWTVCLRLLPDSVATAIWTRTLLCPSPARYYSATEPPGHHLEDTSIK